MHRINLGDRHAPFPLPRLHFAHLPTPLKPLERISKHLDGPNLWIKRDDCTGLSSGGNKTRKLEFLMAEAVKMLASFEGILLDPVYSGKGFAGLIDLVRKGHFKKGENVVFLHTGGSVSLFAYPKVFDLPGYI